MHFLRSWVFAKGRPSHAKTMSSWKRVLILTLIGIGLRALYCAVFSDLLVAGSDATVNILLGRKFASGNYYGVLDTYWPPLYPLLVGAVTPFVDSITLPAVIVSVITGGLAVPVTYWLADQSYGKAAATVAASLAVFFPNLINAVFAIGTESPYLICVGGSLITGWTALKKGSLYSCLFTGAFVGLAYLTRPEAFGYVIFFVLVIVAEVLWTKGSFTRKPVIRISILVIGFAIFAAPYILYLHGETGRWMISGKMEKNVAAGAFSKDAIERSEAAAAKNPESNEQSSRALAMNFASNLREAQKALSSLIPFFLVMLIGIGLFRTSWDRERLFREGYLLAFCLLTILGYSASFVLERYLYVLLPICFVWAANGIIAVKQWYDESTRALGISKLRYVPKASYVPTFLLLCLFVYLFPTNFFVRSKESAWQAAAFGERNAGIWLRHNSEPGTSTFSFSSVPTFYSQTNEFWVEEEDPHQILEDILRNRVEYVVDSERSYDKRPYLAKLPAILKDDPRFELIYEKDEFPGNRIAIYRTK